MSQFKAWPKIGQFKDAIKSINAFVRNIRQPDGSYLFDRSIELPVLEFEGTVKLHGTNAAIRFNADGTVQFQSRNGDITPERDNCGFAAAMSGADLSIIKRGLPHGVDSIVFGEWCGTGVQKGVAISSLPKMFVLFGCYADGLRHPIPDVIGSTVFYSINDFKRYSIKIDMNLPSESQNDLIEITGAVEKECPVGAALGF